MKKPTLYAEIIKKFLPASKVNLYCGADWGRETKACKDVVSLNSITLEQLLSLDKPPFIINSINWFRTVNGREYIINGLKKIKSNQELSNQLKEVSVEEYELKEPLVTSGLRPKPKTIIDFLNYGKD